MSLVCLKLDWPWEILPVVESNQGGTGVLLYLPPVVVGTELGHL